MAGILKNPSLHLKMEEIDLNAPNNIPAKELALNGGLIPKLASQKELAKDAVLEFEPTHLSNKIRCT